MGLGENMGAFSCPLGHLTDLLRMCQDDLNLNELLVDEQTKVIELYIM